MACELPYGQALSSFSDHFPFFEAGVATAGMGDVDAAFTGRGFGHTASDTLEKIHLVDLRDAASVVSRILLRIADVEIWPARRRRPAQVERIKRKEASLEILAVEEELEKLYARKARRQRRSKRA